MTSSWQALGAAAVTPLYALLGHHGAILFVAGPLFGYLGHGYFSVFVAMLAELFPSTVRAIAQGLCYNAGRGISALAPFSVGALADAHGLSMALTAGSLFFVLGGVLMLFLPETRGEALH
jgi:MFS-type transporter involved in bile tolerance (Atg22 family)